ncbi:unnamed protein product, partial [Discosporangium mesarthrocarpum]
WVQGKGLERERERELGVGLGWVVRRCCCFQLEGFLQHFTNTVCVCPRVGCMECTPVLLRACRCEGGKKRIMHVYVRGTSRGLLECASTRVFTAPTGLSCLRVMGPRWPLKVDRRGPRITERSPPILDL